MSDATSGSKGPAAPCRPCRSLAPSLGRCRRHGPEPEHLGRTKAAEHHEPGDGGVPMGAEAPDQARSSSRSSARGSRRGCARVGASAERGRPRWPSSPERSPLARPAGLLPRGTGFLASGRASPDSRTARRWRPDAG